jgi:hypothetical protein
MFNLFLANINDRSLLGKRDSEIAILTEDREFVSTYILNCYVFKRRFFCMSRNTRSKLMRIIYHLHEVMTKFKISIFRYVSQSANKLKKYV